MNAVKTWTVQVEIDEHEDSTRAVARLQPGGAHSLTGTGLARLHPADRDVPRSETNWRRPGRCRS